MPVEQRMIRVTISLPRETLAKVDFKGTGDMSKAFRRIIDEHYEEHKQHGT